jgi:hypothetical protein
MKPVTVILKEVTNALSKKNIFEVEKVVNTLQVKVGEKVDENKISSWIKDKEDWTIQFIK